MNETLEQQVIAALKVRGLTAATAESCTGGLTAKRLTDVPGASAVFLGGVVSYTNGVKERALAVRLARDRLCARLGREPTLSELSDATGLEPEDIAAAETATMPVASIHSESGEEGFTLESVLGDGGMEDEVVERLALRAAIDRLPERERQVVLLRFFKNLTQDRAAKVLGVSQVQVSRIERRALGHLREVLEA